MSNFLFDLEEPTTQSVDRTLRFTVLGRGQQRGSKIPQAIYRNGKPVTKNGRVVVVARDSNDSKSLTYMQEVRTVAILAMDQQSFKMLTNPIELSAIFWFKRPQSHYGSGANAQVVKSSSPKHHAQSPDCAKLVRCLEDALTGIAWQDDKQVFRYKLIERRWTTEHERVDVEIREVV
jgi:Holliday junction resolvase RusA-like endonuclease